MLHSRTLNKCINNIQVRALRLKYKDNQSSFKELLKNNNHSVTVHHKNLQVLTTEIFKIKNDLVTDIMKDLFELIESLYNLRSGPNYLTRGNAKATYYSLSSIKILAPQLWELVPQSVRKCKNLNEFKTKIKSWYPDHCACRLCKTYIAQLGFILSAYIHFLWQNQVTYFNLYLIYVSICLFTYVFDLTYYYYYYYYHYYYYYYYY